MNLEHLEAIRMYELDLVLEILANRFSAHHDGDLTVLEIGAGTGWQAKMLTEKGYSVEAIELEDSNYTRARIWPIVDYDGKNIPFPDNHFDVMFSSNVLEHVPHIDSFHSEMQRVLKEDGIAIHIMPSGTWRLWTTFTHYPFIAKLGFGVIGNRLFSKKAGRQVVSQPDMATERMASRSKLMLLRKAMFVPRHGEFGNTVSEIYYFSKHKWSNRFRKGGWVLKEYLTNELFYTGHMLLGPWLKMPLRKKLSFVLGSSCHIFILENGLNRS